MPRQNYYNGYYEGAVNEKNQPHGKGVFVYNDGERFEGEYRNGKRHGFGTYYFKDGEWFEGEYRKNQRNGRGIHHYADGSWEEGDYADGLLVKTIAKGKSSKSSNSSATSTASHSNGSKTTTFTNEAGTYTGEVNADGNPHGKGVFNFNNGQRYDGKYRDGKRNGFGTYYFKDGERFEGEYLNDKRNGRGKYYYKNGDWFEGEYRDNARNGKGVYHFSNGSWEEADYANNARTKVIATSGSSASSSASGTSASSSTSGGSSYAGTSGSSSTNTSDIVTLTTKAGTYTGTLDKDGKLSGEGMFKFNSGSMYVGYYLHAIRNGFGIYSYTDGSKYSGTFLDGDFHGLGRYSFDNGDLFVGEYRKGKRNGYGVYFYEDGEWFFSLYRDGEEVKTLLSFDDIYRGLGSGTARKLTYSDGEYVGEVTKNYNGYYVANGFGRYKTNGGVVIEGQFENGDNNGYVKIDFGNGINIYGERRNGSFCGDVFEMCKDGAYVGKISDDFHHCGKNCSVYRSDGSWYNGVDSSLSGYGTMYLAEGGWIRGLFENGKSVRIDEKYE